MKPFGFAQAAITKRRSNISISTFTLHRFSESQRGEMFCSPEVARKWLWILRDRFNVVEGQAVTKSEFAGPEAAMSRAIVTVDDAFDDAYEILFPIIRELGIPIILFVPTGFIDRPEQIPVSYNADPRTHRPCTWAQLREMSDSGLVTLGAHSHGHKEVDSISEDELRADCETVATVFRREGLPQPHLYAYPRGVYASRAAHILQDYYDVAFAGAPHHGLPGNLSPMAVPRIPLRGSDAVWAGSLKVRGWPTEEERIIEWAKQARSMVRRNG